MSSVEQLNLEAGTLERDAYLYRLRGNHIIVWADELRDINEFKSVIRKTPASSTLRIESGIVRVDPCGFYLPHYFAPLVEAGFSFNELVTVMMSRIVSFEHEYGKVELSSDELEDLKSIVYFYNRAKSYKLNIQDKKFLIHLESSAEVLYYLLAKTITLTAIYNGWCSLDFTNGGNTRKDYCTIFSDEQIKLLEKVNRSII